MANLEVVASLAGRQIVTKLVLVMTVVVIYLASVTSTVVFSRDGSMIMQCKKKLNITV